MLCPYYYTDIESVQTPNSSLELGTTSRTGAAPDSTHLRQGTECKARLGEEHEVTLPVK